MCGKYICMYTYMNTYIHKGIFIISIVIITMFIDYNIKVIIYKQRLSM